MLVGEPDDHGLAALDGPGGGLRAAGDDVEQRRLPRAVRADDGKPGAGLDQQIDVLEDRQLLGSADVEALRDAFEFDHLVAEAGGAATELQLAAPHADGRRTAGHDLVGGPQPSLRLGRSGRRAATQPGEFLAGEDLAGRLLLHFAVDAFGAGVEVGRVRARPGGRLVDEAPTTVQLHDLARADVGREPVQRVAVVGDEHERRLHLHQPGLQPLDRFEVEVVRRLVEHDEVVVAVLVVGEHLGERHPFRLPTRQLVGTAVEQRLHPEFRGDGSDLPRIAEELADGARRQHRILLERGDPHAPAEPDIALIGRQDPGHDLQQRRLAGSVDADDGDPIAGRHRHREVAEQHLVRLGERHARKVDTDHGRDATARCNEWCLTPFVTPGRGGRSVSRVGRSVGVGGATVGATVVHHVGDLGLGVGELRVGLGLIDPTVGDRLVEAGVEFGDQRVDHGLHLDALRRGDLGERRAVVQLRVDLLGGEAEQTGQRLGSHARTATAEHAAAGTTAMATGATADAAARRARDGSRPTAWSPHRPAQQ